MPDPAHEDPLIQEIRSIAIIEYPLLLWSVGGHAALEDAHPVPLALALSTPTFTSLVESDDLVRLFPHQPPNGKGSRSGFFNTPSSGASVQIGLFAHHLLKAAWRLSVFRGAWSLADLLESLEEFVLLLRLEASGQEQSFPAVFGFTGAGVHEHTRSGSEIAVHPYLGGVSDRLVPKGARPQLKPDGTYNGFICEVSLPWGLRFDPDPMSRPDPATDDQSRRSRVYEIREDLAVAMAIASLPDGATTDAEFGKACQNPVAVRWQWTCSIIPVLSENMSWSRLEPRGVPHLLEPKHVRDAMEFWQQMQNTNDTPVRVAVHRVNRALHERRQMDDRLIDAIIAWENLAGKIERGDITFRTCFVLAFLISTESARQGVVGRLREIYKIRSNLVHGVNLDLDEEFGRQAKWALEVALRGLRSLYTDQSPLLAKKKRFEHLVFNPPPDATSGSTS
jgi:hypothetical protein